MANIKSAKKRIKVTAKKTLHNKMIKSSTKTYMRKLVTACDNNQKDEATELYKKVASMIDVAAKNNIYHKNNAARKKSRFAKMVNKIS